MSLMSEPRFWNFERAAGLFLILGFAANLAGVMMFWMRGGDRGGQPPTQAYFQWERGFILAAVILTAIGFGLLEGQLQNTSGRLLARMGATAYLFAGVLGVAAEALSQTLGYQKLYGVVVIYVITAFLAQAAIGGALLQVRLLAAWLGWVMVLWNIAWLIALPLISPRDIYFPVLHHFAPLLIGGALLWMAP